MSTSLPLSSYAHFRAVQEHLLTVQMQWESAPGVLREAFPELDEPLYEGPTGMVYGSAESTPFYGIRITPAQRAWCRTQLLRDVRRTLQTIELLRTLHERIVHLRGDNLLYTPSVRLRHASRSYYLVHLRSSHEGSVGAANRDVVYTGMELERQLRASMTQVEDAYRVIYELQLTVLNTCPLMVREHYIGLGMDREGLTAYLRDIPANPFLHPALAA